MNVQSSKQSESSSLKGKPQPDQRGKQTAVDAANTYATGNARKLSPWSNDSQDGKRPQSPNPVQPRIQLQTSLGNQALVQRMEAGLDRGAINHLISLRPIIGNQGVTRRLQAKLKVNTPGDHYEQEADRVADRVMGMPVTSEPAAPALSQAASSVQRKCSCNGSGTKCDKCRDEDEEKMLQRSTSTPSAPGYAPAIVHDALHSPGRPLDPATRSFMESRFGHDFSSVRVHTDAVAGDAAAAVQASAYTVGNDVVFAHGNYEPSSDRGRRLLAHELTHVVQQSAGAPATVQRDTNPLRDAPVQSQTSNLLNLLPQMPPELAKQFTVRAMRENEFQALTGIRVNSIPEKKLLSPEDAGLVVDPGLLAGVGAGVLAGPRPTLPLPLGTTGVLWSSDAHLSQFAVVPQENPALSFFFGDAALETYGFRSWLPTHIASTLERGVPGKPFTPFTNMLNRGMGGNYVGDPLYPYFRSVAVYPQGGAENIAGAQQLVACMQEANRSGSLEGTYTFSTPKRTSPAFDRAFGAGAAADPNFQPPEIRNCLNQANALTQQALQGRDLVVNINGQDVNISTATDVATGQPVPGMTPSAAENMRTYLQQFEAEPGAQGLTRTPISGAMWLRGVTGVLRVGGFVLMVYNLGRIVDRYEAASTYDKPLVAGEEATMLTAGLLGSLIGEAIGETVVCAGMGPGFGLCMLAAGVAGGATGGMFAEGPAHDIGKTLQDAAELNRRGQLLPAIVEATAVVTKNQEALKAIQDFKSIEKPRQEDCQLPFCWPF